MLKERMPNELTEPDGCLDVPMTLPEAGGERKVMML